MVGRNLELKAVQIEIFSSMPRFYEKTLQASKP